MFTSLFSRSQMHFKIGVLKNFAIITEKKLALESLFNKVAGLQAFCCENCEIVQSNLFYRTPLAAFPHVLLYHGVVIQLKRYIFKKTLLNML